MEKNDIEKILDNINISMFIFHEEKDGMIEFKPADNLIAENNSISFSVLLSIEYNETIKNNLELNLIKLDPKDSDTLKCFLLESFSFDENNSLSGVVRKYFCDSSVKIPSIDIKNFEFNHTLRYSFNKIPLCGEGIYFVSVCINDQDGVMPIKSVPIEIEFNKNINSN